MFSRRSGLIAALLVTAALLLGMPGLLSRAAPTDTNRMHQRLRPQKAHTLTVWLLPGQMADDALVRSSITAFEKQHSGVRVFLRSVSLEECTAPDAVLPDVMLFETGAITLPEKLFIPLQQADPSGMHAGVGYAAALWLEPWVLSLPAQWLESPSAPTPAPGSLLGAAPAPTVSPPQTASIPWGMLCQPDALTLAEGTARMQLLSMCPPALRAQLISPPAPTAAPVPTDGVPRSRGVQPSATPARLSAQVQTLAAYQASQKEGKAAAVFALTPAVSDRVRYGAICRDGPEARAFLSHLRTQTAQEAILSGKLCLHASADAPSALAQDVQALFQNGYALPNAFAHTREALESLCRDAFLRNADPVETLLRLR